MNEESAALGLAACLSDRSLESLERAIKCLRVPCPRPPGLLRWLESTFRKGAPTALCYECAILMGKERWADEGPALVEECSRLTSGIASHDLAILSWAVQCGFASKPVMQEAEGALRARYPTMRDDEDLLAAIHFLVQWLSVLTPNADAALVMLLHDISNHHFTVSYSRIYCSHNVALMARALTSVVSPQLSSCQRVELVAFPDTKWLAVEVLKPLIEAACELDLDTTAKRLPVDLLHFCNWKARENDLAVLAARMAQPFQATFGPALWKALLPCLRCEQVKTLVKGFAQPATFDGMVWKDFNGDISEDWNGLLLASVQALIALPAYSTLLVNLIGLCHLQLGGRPEVVQCFDSNRASMAVTLTDAELCETLTTLSSSTSDKETMSNLFSSFQLGFGMACSGLATGKGNAGEESTHVDTRFMVWMGHTLATQLVARKLRLMPKLANPQALFSQLARFLASISAGERPAASRISQLIICFTVQRLELAMQAAVANDDKFYVANQRVCEDFFARIRGVLIGAFSHLGAWHEVAQQWLLILPEMRALARSDASKVPDLVGCVCSALSVAGEYGFSQVADALVLFGRAVEAEFGVKMPFLGAMSFMAHRRLEEAARLLRSCLESVHGESFITVFLVSQINVCYLLLGSLGQASEWLASGGAAKAGISADSAKKMRLTALQRFTGTKEFVPIPNDGPAVAMSCWVVENVTSAELAAGLVRQVVCADLNSVSLSLCSLHYVARFGMPQSFSGRGAQLVPLWGFLKRAGQPVAPELASVDLLEAGNVNAAVEVSGLESNAKLFHMELRVQRSLSVDVPAMMRQSLHEDGNRAAVLLKALQKNLVVGANKLDRDLLVSCVTDSRVLGLYLAHQLHGITELSLRSQDKEALSKWLSQDARVPPAKQGLTLLLKLSASPLFFASDAGPSWIASSQIPPDWNVAVSGVLEQQLVQILTGIREHFICKQARSCFVSLAKTLAAAAHPDVEVALSLVRALEASGCVALFLELVSPVFQHSSWLEVIPQLLARIGDSRIGLCISALLEALAAASSSHAQALYWPVKTSRDGASWKLEQREGARVLCERIERLFPQVCAGCSLLYDGVRLLGALWEEQWHRVMKGLVSALRRNNGPAIKAMQDQACALFAATVGRSSIAGLSPHQLAFFRSMGGPLQHLVALIRDRSPSLVSGAQELLAELTRICDTCTSISLSEISPTLCQLSNQRILIPGSDAILFSFGAKVDVLRTKTRPKRVMAIAVDGTTQLLLVKHGEDLRLDERLMQVFKTAKQWHYAVVPVGPFCGLIHIVDGLVSLFDLFRKQPKQEEYYAKLQARLSASKRHSKWLSEVQNARDIEHHRAEWGGEKAILLDIFRELSKSNPSDLVQRELLRQSLAASDWIRRVDNFSESTARISMLGYVIGLGDRHLDNILFDAQTGRVLHIDLSVCFESGKLLKVPELVPFRLTQNIRGGMRYGAIDGAFADLCTAHLEQLREKSSEISMLLEAFALDEIQGGNAKKRRREYSGGAVLKRVEQVERKRQKIFVCFSENHQKLSGNDFGRSDMTAREQAQLAIDAAVSEENLCNMYSGWGAYF